MRQKYHVYKLEGVFNIKFTWKKIGLGTLALSATVLAACSPPESGGDQGSTGQVVDGQEIEIAHIANQSDMATTRVVGTILDDMGYDVTYTNVDHAIMWQSVAQGEADLHVTGWLPVTHGSYYEENQDQLEHLGTNLSGARLGLAVPSYMDAESIEDLSDQAGQTITAIEPGAGATAAAQETQQTYDDLSDWSVQTSSTGAMLTELEQALNNEEEFVFTGWTPHWMFQQHDIKYLEDPEGSMGQEETIEMFGRQGFTEEYPEAAEFLSNFSWEVEDIESVMLEMQEGASAEEAAQNWIDENQDQVEEWTAGIGETAESSQ